MPQRHRILLALPRHDAIRKLTESALTTASNLGLGNFVITRDISEAVVVLTDSATINFDLKELPETVRYLQLVDCGSGAPHATDDQLTVANVSSLLADGAANWAIQQWQEIISHSAHKTKNIAGIIGFGTLGYELGKRLRELDTQIQIWINDIRTPRQQSFQFIEARRSSIDMLLSTSDVIFIAVHHGPTSNPLLSHREMRLLNVSATIVNLSGEKVVNRKDVEILNTLHEMQINYREIPPELGNAYTPHQSTQWILNNLGNWALGNQPRSIVENVSFPSAGDPAFWASKMSPRQTPV